jgi:membrane protein DedA with SNARE-associated domain
MSDWVVQLIDAGGYWGIAFLMVLENVFPPIPSELIMGIGGIRVGQGRMEMLPLLVAGTIGTTIGNFSWYLLGYRLGFKRLKPLIDRHGRWLTLRWRDVEWLDRCFETHGEKIVFIFRFMPAFRTIVSLPAGLFRMSPWKFTLWTTGGALIWNIILAGCGYYLGYRFEKIDDWLGPLTNVAVGFMVVAYVWRLVTWKSEKAERLARFRLAAAILRCTQRRRDAEISALSSPRSLRLRANKFDRFAIDDASGVAPHDGSFGSQAVGGVHTAQRPHFGRSLVPRFGFGFDQPGKILRRQGQALHFASAVTEGAHRRCRAAQIDGLGLRIVDGGHQAPQDADLDRIARLHRRLEIGAQAQLQGLGRVAHVPARGCALR